MPIVTRPRCSATRLGVLALAALLPLAGCSLLRGRPDLLPPAAKLYENGEADLLRDRHEDARDAFRRLVERHPDSALVPRARFLIGEAHYRQGEFNQAIAEFDAFMNLYPGHEIADLVQYRLARSYFDQMPSVERDQALTAKALAEFQKLLKRYPESRYAPDAIVKIEASRLRLAQKELWVAEYYVRQGNLQGSLQRYDVVLRDYARTPVAPQALLQKADALLRLGRADEAGTVLRRLVEEFPQSEWARRAREQHAQLL